ncbi:uncharacterized protein LOC100835007 isoform X4 [Brachypodium distachyon]|uniref:Uncharacterized protein n=1 Tax=Brachypodium distachyon TaxID=15368 RepID=A0A2K2D6W1_BRADI|nr:uncharacterized protein LOC100835007 isoform X4 [Brachypodium distachyon]PNT70003.1 hypothetical protein BRADI_2g04151v3 [Brachypodium distachyon]|eukprot:XP_014753887.1 uncharacterized protein LOC100835007 isoform X4 [Brachypodium distachyon]
MLQWMGGSRRKVYTSRKSIQSRQRQYFEQKKRRQQQREGLQNQDDIDGADVDSTVLLPQMDCTILNPSPIEALKKITSVYNINPKETSSQPRLSSPIGHQDVAVSVNPHEDPVVRKISPSKNSGVKKRNLNVDLHSGEISLIDLVNYEGPNNKSTAQPAREPHVSFFVKGLGHVEMETPPQSPRSTKRVLPLPPKAMRYTQNKTRRSIPFDATKGLDSILKGISMMKERISSDKMGSLVDESNYERRKNSYSSHSFENYNGNLYPEDEDMFCEPQAQKGWQSKHGRIVDSLPAINSERLWKMESFNSDDHFGTPRAEQFDPVDYGFKERYSPEQRTLIGTSSRFQTSANPSGHDHFSDQLLLDDDNDMVHFDWERHPPIKKIPNSNSTFGPAAWSFDMVDDSDKRRSPLSEESCSSAAAMNDRTNKKPLLSVKCEENNMNKKDDFHTRLDKLDIPEMDAHLDGISLFGDQEYHKRTTDLRNLEASYCPDKAIKQQRTREPNCRLSLQEKFADWGSSTSHLKGSTGLHNPSNCTGMHEDKPFNSIPDVGGYHTVGSTERRPAPRVHPVSHRPDNANLYDDTRLQNPVSDTFGDNIEFSDPFCGKDLQSNIDACTFLGQKVDRKKEDDFDPFKNPNADIFHSAGSVGQSVNRKKEDNFDPFKNPNADVFHSAGSVGQSVVGQHTTCSQQSARDELRQGFNPGIDFQETRLNSFWEDGHVSNGTFRGDIELSDLLARENGEKNKDKIERSEKPETAQPSADFRIKMSEAETCSDGSEVTNCPGVQKETSTAATQPPANLSCLQDTSRGMFEIHARVDCIRKEMIESPVIDFEAPLHVRNKIHDVGDHTKRNYMFQSPFAAEKVGIEKKVITGVSPNNSDVQYEVMLERRVLQRLSVQKILVDTPIKDKLDKVTHFRRMEDGSHVLARSV